MTITDLYDERNYLMAQYTRLALSDKAGRDMILKQLLQLNGEIQKIQSATARHTSPTGNYKGNFNQ